MLSLMVLLLLIAVFALLAIRNWKKAIGAGPTILIIGFILLSSFGLIKWGDYVQHQREYDVCSGRVDRSQVSYAFNITLVKIIERELPNKTIGQELRDVLLEPLDISSCGEEPEFFNPF